MPPSRLIVAVLPFVLCGFSHSLPMQGQEVAGAPVPAFTRPTSATTTTLQVSPATGAVGTKFILTVAVTDRGGPETAGTVSFYNGADLLGTADILVQANAHGAVGSASFITRGLPIGANAITAKFSGAGLDLPSTSAVRNVTVSGIYSSATTLAAVSTYGTYQLNAAVLANGPGTPTGTVTFTDVTHKTALGTVAVGASTTTFSAKPPITLQQGAADAALGDLNGDGILDMAVAGYGEVSVALGNGDGTFASPTLLLAPSYNETLSAVALADLNGDGNLDVIATSYGVGAVMVNLGNGDGTFGATVDYPVDLYTSSVAVADFNGDGILDVVTANSYSQTVSVLLGKGDGTFQAKNSFPTNAAAGEPCSSVTVGDYNGDGKMDAAVNNAEGTISLFLGKGDGTFAPQVTVTGSIYSADGPRAIATGDLNGDGKLDLVLANSNYSVVGIFLGNGDGTFQAIQQYPIIDGLRPDGVIVADINGDGKPDIAVSSQNDSSFGVLLNRGNQHFDAAGYAVDYGFASLAVGDLNSDGIQDVVLAGDSGLLVNVVLGQTAFTISLAKVSPPLSGSETVSAQYSGDARFTGSTSNTQTLQPMNQGVATPTFSLPAGTYTTAQTVKLADATAGATIYYTTDGTAPTTASTRYTAAIIVGATEKIEAIGVEAGYTTSAIAHATFTINITSTTPAAAPTITLATGTYAMPTSTTITGSAGTNLFYCASTSGNCTPGTAYASAVTINASPTEYLCAYATATGYAQSATVCHVYTKAATVTTAATPTFSMPAGTYTGTQTIALADVTPGAIIYYTTTGTAPTTASPRYTTAITVSVTEKIEAIAVAPGYNTSSIAHATFTIH